MGKRKGIITEYIDICFFCGAQAECTHHLIFGRNRRLAEEDGIKVPVCNHCHNMSHPLTQIHDNPMAEKLSKMLGQALWEQHYGDREAFRKRYGKSYL